MCKYLFNKICKSISNSNLEQSSILSNNSIASHNKLFALENCSLLTLFKKTQITNINNFYNNLPASSKELLNNPQPEYMGFIAKTIELSANEPWCHDELEIILAQYISEEVDTNKLRLKNCLDLVGKLNKRLFQILQLIVAINDTRVYKTSEEFITNYPKEFIKEYRGIESINEDDIVYLFSIGALDDSAGNMRIDYPMPTRIAFFIWCKYQIHSQEERDKLTNKVEAIYAKDNNFKVLCDTIFNCKLHRYEPSQLVNDLFYLQYKDFTTPSPSTIRISDLNAL